MKRTIVLAAFVLISVPFAHAENRLFPTDILKKGEIDLAGEVEDQSLSYDVNLAGIPGSRSQHLTRETLSARYGFGSDWHAGVSIAYNSKYEILTDYSSTFPSSTNRDLEGTENPRIFARYGFVNGSTNPFSLSGELMVSPNTTGSPSTYGGKLSAAWKSNDTLRLYGTYSIIMANDSSVSDKNGISFGAHKNVSGSVSINPFVSYTRVSSTRTFSSFDQYGVGISAHVQIDGNTYLIPAIANYGNSSVHSKDGVFHTDSTHNGKVISLGLYHLF